MLGRFTLLFALPSGLLRSATRTIGELPDGHPLQDLQSRTGDDGFVRAAPSPFKDCGSLFKLAVEVGDLQRLRFKTVIDKDAARMISDVARLAGQDMGARGVVDAKTAAQEIYN